MKLWFVGAYLFCLLLPAALGLKCYHCGNTKSWDECKASSTSDTCTIGHDRCTKVYAKSGEDEYFEKYCITKAGCNEDYNPTCLKPVGSYECDIHCCDSDDCNAGSAFRVSSILLLTCALAPLMILAEA